MVSRLIVYTGDGTDTLLMRRNIATALRQVGVPEADLERVLAFYASDIQQIAVSPPPLPHRPSSWDTQDTQSAMPSTDTHATEITRNAEHSPTGKIIPYLALRAQSYSSPALDSDPDRPSLSSNSNSKRDSPVDFTSLFIDKSQLETANQEVKLKRLSSKPQLGPDIEFVLVAGDNVDAARVAQAYFEILRVQLANDCGSWMFRSVRSAGVGSFDAPYYTEQDCRLVATAVRKEAYQDRGPRSVLEDLIVDVLIGYQLRKLFSVDFTGTNYVIIVLDEHRVDDLERIFHNFIDYDRSAALKARTFVLLDINIGSTHQI